MSIDSITRSVAAGDYYGQTVGQSFVAVAASEELARQVGPLLAERLEPSRRWGRVLHVERIDSDRFEVVVEDRGSR